MTFFGLISARTRGAGLQRSALHGPSEGHTVETAAPEGCRRSALSRKVERSAREQYLEARTAKGACAGRPPAGASAIMKAPSGAGPADYECASGATRASITSHSGD